MHLDGILANGFVRRGRVAVLAKEVKVGISASIAQFWSDVRME